MAFEDLDTERLEEEEIAPPEESSNRTFFIIAGVLGAIALCALLGIAAYALWFLPQNNRSQEAQRATLQAQNTEVQRIINSTSTAVELAKIVAAYTATPTITPIPPTATATASKTPVVAVPTTAVGPGEATEGTVGPDMATATALHATLDANATLYAATLTARPLQPTEYVPDTGFADNVGLPLMLGLAVLLVVVIIVARRFRTAH